MTDLFLEVRKQLCERVFLTLTFAVVQIVVTVGQLPSIERFAEYRNAVVQNAEGRQLNTKVSSLFKIPLDIRIAEAIGMVLPAVGDMRRMTIVKRRLTMWVSIDSDDMFLMESRESATDVVVVTIFHAEIQSLSLRSAATGAGFDDLQLIPNDQAEHDFREVLMAWDHALPVMLKRFR